MKYIVAFIVPVLIAGLVRVFTDKYKVLNIPLDFGAKIRGRSVFGENKKLQGVLVLSIVSMFIGFFFYKEINTLPMYYGFILGIFYSLGELVNSFVKRRLGILPGQNSVGFAGVIQYFFDQADSIFAISIIIFFWQIDLIHIIFIGIFGVLLHCIVDILNHFYGSKKYDSKYGLILFYQFITYFLVYPLKIFSRGTLKLPNERNLILTSNHISGIDFFYIFGATTFREYLRFIPFKFIVYSGFYNSWYGIVLKILGGVSSEWEDLYENRPVDEMKSSMREGFNIIIFYEGKRTNGKLPTHELKTGFYKVFKANPDSKIIVLRIINSGKSFYITQKDYISHDNDKLTSSKNFLERLNNVVYE